MNVTLSCNRIGDREWVMSCDLIACLVKRLIVLGSQGWKWCFIAGWTTWYGAAGSLESEPKWRVIDTLRMLNKAREHSHSLPSELRSLGGNESDSEAGPGKYFLATLDPRLVKVMIYY